MALTPEQKIDVEARIASFAATKNIAGDPGKAVFCSDWSTVKQALDFIKPFVPAPFNLAVAAIEEVGDLTHGQICK